jgi:hypothetical protein
VCLGVPADYAKSPSAFKVQLLSGIRFRMMLGSSNKDDRWFSPNSGERETRFWLLARLCQALYREWAFGKNRHFVLEQFNTT